MPPENWVKVLKALADHHRLALMRELLGTTRSVNELARKLDMTQYNVSKHLRVLWMTGLVVSKRDGTRKDYTVNPALVRAAGPAASAQLDLGCCSFDFEKPVTIPASTDS